MLKIFATFCKRLVSKVSYLVLVPARSNLGLVSTFCYKSSISSRSYNVNVSSHLGLEDFGRDSSSDDYINKPEISSHPLFWIRISNSCFGTAGNKIVVLERMGKLGLPNNRP